MGDTMLESQRVLSGNIIVRPRSLTSSDVMNISSLLFLPESTFAFSRINLPSTSVMTKSDLNHHFIQYWAFLNQLTVPTTQIIDDMSGNTMVSCSSVEIKKFGKNNVESSKEVGLKLAEKAKKKGIKEVLFDRGGYLYHGKIKSFAEGAREGGLIF